MIWSNVVPMKLSPKLVIVESWILGGLSFPCRSVSVGSRLALLTVVNVYTMSLWAWIPQCMATLRKVGRHRSRRCGRESPTSSSWARSPELVALNNSFRSWQLTSQLFRLRRKDIIGGGMEYIERVQDMPPQNRWLCHIDYFELKTAEARRAIWHFFFFLEAGDNIPRWKLPSCIRRKKQHCPRRGLPDWDNFV